MGVSHSGALWWDESRLRGGQGRGVGCERRSVGCGALFGDQIGGKGCRGGARGGAGLRWGTWCESVSDGGVGGGGLPNHDRLEARIIMAELRCAREWMGCISINKRRNRLRGLNLEVWI